MGAFDEPNPRFAQLLLEQFGGATGELSAALQYWVQSFYMEDAGIKDMLQDMATEEFSHVEMIGKLSNCAINWLRTSKIWSIT